MSVDHVARMAIADDGTVKLAATVAANDLWAPSRGVIQNRPVALRILENASRGIGDITSVLGTPATYSQGSTNANSTINTGATVFPNGGASAEGVSAIIQKPECTLAAPGSSAFPNTILFTVSPVARGGSRGLAIRFACDGPAVDFAINCAAGATMVMYVTDLLTGVRQRATANDQTPTAGLSYHKYTFSGAAKRIIELYTFGVAGINGINVGAGYKIWSAPSPDPIKAALVWDSWGQGNSSGGATNIAKLWTPDYMGEALGLLNIPNLCRSGTGFGAGGNSGTFAQRIIIGGDLDISRRGVLDLIIMPGSINDTLTASAQTDAVVKAGAQAAFAAAMVAQPQAIIIGMGQAVTPNAPFSQSRQDAIKAGFDAAAAGDKRMVWVPQTWLTDANATSYVSSDHPTDAGKAYIGRQMGYGILNAVAAAYA